MTTVNAYATRAELLQRLMPADGSAAPDVVDDAVIDDILTDASRAVDHYCARQFYASAETLYLDATWDRRLWFGADVLAVQGASNGSGAVAAGNYYLWPRGAQAYAAIVLKESASTGWYAASTGDTEGAITIAASVGYCDRAASAASDPQRNLEVIANTHEATLIRAAIVYRQRHPSSVEQRVQKDADWQALVSGYARRVY